MAVRRIVPDLQAADLTEARDFYSLVLGLEPAMDLGWVLILADPDRPAVQLMLLTADATAPVTPAVSIEVDDVDEAYAAAQAAGAEILHPLTDEPWGVRRFFVRDPAGAVLNILSHREA